MLKVTSVAAAHRLVTLYRHAGAGVQLQHALAVAVIGVAHTSRSENGIGMNVNEQ
jgi:hypothetical protein